MTQRKLNLALGLSLAATAATAADVAFVAPAAGDLVPASIKVLPAVKTTRSAFAAGPAHFAHALPADIKLSAPTPFANESKQYTQVVGGAALAQGIELKLSRGEAIVRLSPRGGTKAGLRFADLQFGMADGTKRDVAAVASTLADEAALKAAGVDFGAGTLAFRIADGAAVKSLIAPRAAGDYLLHVFEPQSPVSMGLVADRSVAFLGEALAFDVDFNADKPQFEAFVASPAGEIVPASVSRIGDAWQGIATLPNDMAADGHDGLWEINVYAQGVFDGKTVAREVRTAVAISTAGAKLSGFGRFDVSGNSVAVELPIEVATPARYEVRAALTVNGVPVAMGHAADELVAGQDALALRFDGLAIAPGDQLGLLALQLADQDRMSVIERRHQSLRYAVPMVMPERAGSLLR